LDKDYIIEPSFCRQSIICRQRTPGKKWLRPNRSRPQSCILTGCRFRD